MTVPRETLAQSGSGGGAKYVSPYRLAQGERTRAAIITATLKLIERGNFRPEAKEIAVLADIHRSAVTRLFGSVDLLYRVIAREHASAVMSAVRGPDPLEEDDLAWLIMVGKRRETPWRFRVLAARRSPSGAVAMLRPASWWRGCRRRNRTAARPLS